MGSKAATLSKLICYTKNPHENFNIRFLGNFAKVCARLSPIAYLNNITWKCYKGKTRPEELSRPFRIL